MLRLVIRKGAAGIGHEGHARCLVGLVGDGLVGCFLLIRVRSHYLLELGPRVTYRRLRPLLWLRTNDSIGARVVLVVLWAEALLLLSLLLHLSLLVHFDAG